MMRIIVTGASGFLGSAVYVAFKSAGATVLGLAHSQPTDELRQLDLVNLDATQRILSEFKPDWVIHCAAVTRPDAAQKDPDAARKMNVAVPENLANLSKTHKFKLIYISTDYVFDGTSAPYLPSAQTNPVNLYGETKRDGELAVLGVSGASCFVLRIPILYGPAPQTANSAVNILLDVVTDQSGKKYSMDHYATRFPTNTLDLADFLVRLTSLPPSRVIPPILHYAAGEPFTKYEMCLVFARILGLPHTHIVSDDQPPKSGTLRPQNTQLYVRETEDLMEGYGGLGWNPFEEWWSEYLVQKQ